MASWMEVHSVNRSDSKLLVHSFHSKLINGELMSIWMKETDTKSDREY